MRTLYLSLLAGIALTLAATNPSEVRARFRPPMPVAVMPRAAPMAAMPRAVPVRPVMPMNNNGMSMNNNGMHFQQTLPNPLLAAVLFNRFYSPYGYNPYAYGNSGYPTMPAYSSSPMYAMPSTSYSSPYMMYSGGYGYTPSYSAGYGNMPSYSGGYGNTSYSQPANSYIAAGNSPTETNPYLAYANAASTQLASVPLVQSARTVDVGVFDDYFEPITFVIRAGTTVRWTNRGSMRHMVTSDLGLWDSSELAPGGTTSYTFLVPGTYTYYCSFHARSMRGAIVVE